MSAHVAPTHSMIRIRGTASIQAAASLMCDLSRGALGVDGPDHEFIGLITERDLLWALAQGKDPIETAVKEVVNDFPIIIDGPISPIQAAKRMRAGHVRHLIIRYHEDLHVLSMRDLLSEFLDELGSAGVEHPASLSELRQMFGAGFMSRGEASDVTGGQP